MRALAHPSPDQLALPTLLHALSDPVRLQIVCSLRDGREICCGELDVPVSRSTLSHHLRVLRDAGLTRTRAEGVQRLVSLRAQDVDDRFPGLLRCVLDEFRPRPRIAHVVVADRGSPAPLA